MDVENNPVGAYAIFEDEHWWFAGRRQILQRLARRLIEPSRDRLVIDVGCGPGGNLASLSGMYRCLGVDNSAEAIELASARFPAIEFVRGLAPVDISTQAAEADLWLLMDVLEHVEDDHSMFQGLAVAAKPGSHFLITVPAEPSMWSPHDEAAGHHRRYTAETLAGLWSGLPFEVRLLSACNTHLYWPVKAVRTLTAKRGRPHGDGSAQGLDLRLPPAFVNGMLTALFATEATRLADALGNGRPGFRHGVSLIAVLRRLEDDAEPSPRVPQEASSPPLSSPSAGD
jgi:SAM-dependent methyltransferase